MLSEKQQQRVKQLEIVTRRLLHGTLGGEHVTRQRGFGSEFYQLREYVCGDDVRFIDWKSSARFARVLTRECFQDKNRTVVIALDVSQSQQCGRYQAKIDCARDAAAIFAFASFYARDRVGLVTFAQDIVQQVPVGAGYGHVAEIVRAIYETTAAGTTQVAHMLKQVANGFGRNSVIIVISDFVAPMTIADCAAVSGPNDVIFVRCLDEIESQVPAIGLVLVRDSESGAVVPLNTHAGARAINAALRERMAGQDLLCARSGIDCVDIRTGDDACVPLINFFKRRLLSGARI